MVISWDINSYHMEKDTVIMSFGKKTEIKLNQTSLFPTTDVLRRALIGVIPQTCVTVQPLSHHLYPDDHFPPSTLATSLVQAFIICLIAFTPTWSSCFYTYTDY